ncbi:hypothetical protein Cantr_08814 [Candida viswanathii]|uniref:Uncharacterized protein n=1 Tax=Candida viswanathii TaxID=5486 RepID=A0A367YD10_9ASCO|nr:hypothetical protein Cantr_08814 [Candida viswanathii]
MLATEDKRTFSEAQNNTSPSSAPVGFGGRGWRLAPDFWCRGRTWGSAPTKKTGAPNAVGGAQSFKPPITHHRYFISFTAVSQGSIQNSGIENARGMVLDCCII